MAVENVNTTRQSKRLTIETATEIDLKQIETLFHEICIISRQIDLVASAMACGNIEADVVDSISILSKQAGMLADMGMQKFGPGMLGGPANWLLPSSLLETA